MNGGYMGTGPLPEPENGSLIPRLVVMSESTERLFEWQNGKVVMPEGARVIAIGSPADPNANFRLVFEGRDS